MSVFSFDYAGLQQIKNTVIIMREEIIEKIMTMQKQAEVLHRALNVAVKAYHEACRQYDADMKTYASLMQSFSQSMASYAAACSAAAARGETVSGSAPTPPVKPEPPSQEDVLSLERAINDLNMQINSLIRDAEALAEVLNSIESVLKTVDDTNQEVKTLILSKKDMLEGVSNLSVGTKNAVSVAISKNANSSNGTSGYILDRQGKKLYTDLLTGLNYKDYENLLKTSGLDAVLALMGVNGVQPEMGMQIATNFAKNLGVPAYSYDKVQEKMNSGVRTDADAAINSSKVAAESVDTNSVLQETVKVAINTSDVKLSSTTVWTQGEHTAVSVFNDTLTHDGNGIIHSGGTYEDANRVDATEEEAAGYMSYMQNLCKETGMDPALAVSIWTCESGCSTKMNAADGGCFGLTWYYTDHPECFDEFKALHGDDMYTIANTAYKNTYGTDIPASEYQPGNFYHDAAMSQVILLKDNSTQNSNLYDSLEQYIGGPTRLPERLERANELRSYWGMEQLDYVTTMKGTATSTENLCTRTK